MAFLRGLFDGRFGAHWIIGAAVSLMLLPGKPATAQADFRRGDANVDGRVDLADSSYIVRLFWIGGVDSPTCWDAVNVVDTRGSIDAGQGSELFRKLYGGCTSCTIPDPGPYVPGPDPTPDDPFNCVAYNPAPIQRLADFSLGFEAPRNFSQLPDGTITFEIFATLTTSNNKAAEGADGWSLSLGAENLRIVSATTAGTAGARVADDPKGLRDSSGLERTAVVDPGAGDGEGAVSAVLLFTGIQVRTLPRAGTQRVLSLTLEAPAPIDPSKAARLFFVDGKKGPGQPVVNVVSLKGTAQTPALGETSIDLTDCNANGTPDIADVASGTSQDCNHDGLPDECERDCNRNGVADSCELASGAAFDCNQDGILDSCESSVPPPDCNSNGIPDACDILSGASRDCNSNGVPDSCDISSGTSGDCDQSGVPDECEMNQGAAMDCNSNAIPDTCDIATGASSDANSDGIPDDCQGCPDPEPVTCPAGGDPLFRFSFRKSLRGRCDHELVGAPGETVRADVACMIETYCLDGTGGAEGWVLGATIVGGDVLSATLEGTPAAQADFKVADVIDPAMNEGKRGVVSAVLLDTETYPPAVTLNPRRSPEPVLLMTVEAKVPEDGSCAQLLLRYEDGLVGRGLPAENYVRHLDLAFHPIAEPFAIDFCPAAQGGLQLPGDANQDSSLDLSDAIWLLGHLFLGTAPKLPCEGGTASTPGPGDLAVADFNGDGTIDISDAVGLLSFLFLGGGAPALGKECIPIAGCPDRCAR